MAIRFTSDTLCLDTSLPIAERDALFDGVASGLWAFDSASAFGYPRQGAARNGDILRDLKVGGIYGDGDVTIFSGQSMGYGGGMLQMDGMTSTGSYVAGPSGVIDAIWGESGSGATATASVTDGVATATITGAGSGYVSGQAQAVFSGGGLTWPVAVTCTVVGGEITAIPSPIDVFSGTPTVVVVPSPQYFLWCGYFRLPALADWNDSSANVGMLPLFSCVAGGLSHLAAPDLFTVGMGASGSVLFLRKTSASPYTNRNLSMSIGSAMGGKVVQLAFWRDAGGIVSHARVLEAGAASTRITRATGEHANPESFAARRPKWGLASASLTTLSGAKLTAADTSFGRGFVEALGITGRDPAAVVDADWDRTLARGVFLADG